MENKQPLLLLVDGNALVHRAFHALPPLTVPKTGETVGAVYGFAMMLIKAINELKPSHYAVAFDRKAPTFRHEMYDQYKAHRPPMAEELVGQLGRVREVVNVFNIPIFEMDGYEADDILGALSTQAARQDIDTVIMTGDADMMQLVSPKVKVYYPRPGGSFSDAVLYDEEAVKTRYGVTPIQIADLKALKGDTSDNIPGVPGVGEKTALKLVLQFGSVEQLLPRLNEIEPAKLKERIELNLDILKMSLKLATIQCATPVKLDYDACCQVSNYDRAKVAELFRELGFNSLIAKLPESQTSTPSLVVKTEAPVIENHYDTITTQESLDAFIRGLTLNSSIAIHVEGSSTSPMSSELTGIALSPAEGQAVYLPLSGNGSLSRETTLSKLKPILESPFLAKKIHNAKYPMVLLQKYGIGLQNLVFDSLVAAHLLGEKSTALKDLIFNRLGIEITPSASGKTGSKQMAMFAVDNEQLAAYACAAADMTGRISTLLAAELKAIPELDSLFQKVELPLVPILAEMEKNGILLDCAMLAIMSQQFSEQLKGIESKIYQLAKEEFNINSPQQMAVVLFDHLHLPGKKVHGKYSTDASILEELKEHAIIQSILEYRTLMKLKSTYIDALPALVDPQTCRLHTTFNQTRTSTGRLSSNDPNLQNIPVKSELGRQIRKAFIAPPGHILIAGDYSQIDLRALAHLSGDANLMEAFRQDQDIHAATAAQLYSIPISEVKPEMRRFAKTINFGVIYGMSEFGLEQATDLSRQEAGKFITAYFEKYPGVARYMEATKEQARKTGYVQTLLGRRRYVPEVNSSNRQIREAAERMATNMPVQGTSSDIIKVAMIDLQRELKAKGYQSRMLLQVHDELIFEAPLNEAEIIANLVQDKMCAAVQLSVPLKVDMKSGPNWGAME